MRTLLILLAILTIGCEKDQQYEENKKLGTIHFSLKAPILKSEGGTSKVPSCSNKEPTEIRFSVTNNRGFDYTYISPLQKVDGKYLSNSSSTMDFGVYTLTSVSLMNGNDTIYALPYKDEIQLSPFWDTVLPLDITVDGEELVSGTVFCFNKYPAPDISGLINGGFDPMRLQSLWIANLNGGCVSHATVQVDDYMYPTITFSGKLLEEVIVPLDYDVITIIAYQLDWPMQTIVYDSINPYNPDGVMTEDDLAKILYDCY
ncbi:hypothetical protein [Arenibacter lacus]|uniref:hypothetical protein n=1 Tax=Arenibacter lacus TaxID=2608629 RepID=UPI00123D8436|nr:hypothetical protein [Arenibacter lacus]